MPKLIHAALIALATSACVPETPPNLLAPLDRRVETRWQPPPSPTAGLSGFKPSEPRDWRELNHAVTPAPDGGASGGGMSGMPGMGSGGSK